MSNAPIQVILNADSFRRDRQTTRPVSAGTDFFEGMDNEFSIHKQRLQSQAQDIADQLSAPAKREMTGDISYVKVSMRAQALAKSHRPLEAIFPVRKTPMVGGNKLGEMISEVSLQSIDYVMSAIGKAEINVRSRPNKNTGELEPVPTRYRCEVSAIERIELWGKADRRKFDIQEAIRWLSDPRTGHVYIVELFERPLNGSQRDVLSDSKRLLHESFEKGLKQLGDGVVVRVPRHFSNDSIFVEICLTTEQMPPAIFVQSFSANRQGSINFDQSLDRHQALIGFIESHPIVREIRLPNIAVQSSVDAQASISTVHKLPKPAQGATYPKVGIIDGGVSPQFNDWTVYRYNYLAPQHIDLEHGTFIGGLLVSARSLNPTISVDRDGCFIADIDLFPDENKLGAFEKYYPGGLSDFFDELENAVQICRQQFGIRIFNLSLNIISPVTLTRYSLEARRLDQIAEDNDSIIIISAGNLDGGRQRPEWPADDTKAAAILASHRDDQLYIPAESVRNLSVSAINPPGLTDSIDGALARYSRRGPGLRAGVKPDLCHVGGSGTLNAHNGHGLFSVTPHGSIVSSCGTSYAAPLVAKTLAAIDAFIEGEPSRETLIALAIHHAILPQPVSRKPISGIAKQLVGFGQPQPAETALIGDDHEITLLFSSRIFEKKTMEFRFVWPPSLVGPGGKCRGDIKLTMVSSPHLDYQYGEELVRANIEAALQQEKKNGKYSSELDPTYVFFTDDEKANESSLIEHKFKWSPIKAFGAHIPKGRGTSSNWRLVVNYLTRAGEKLPDEGIPFSVLLTISDPDKASPVFREMHQSLQAAGVQTADIRTAARVTPRV